MKKTVNILLVEDDFNLGLVLQDTLQLEGYKVHLTRDGKEGLNLFNKNKYDLCLLDVMMPKKDGFSLASDIRKLDKHVPVVFLTAKSMIEDKIEGLKIGADDYITKPFENEELLLRIKAILKRSTGYEKDDENNLFSIGNFTYDHEKFLLINTQENTEKKLTKKEADLLKLFTSYFDQVVEREMILNMVWGDDSYFLGRSLDVFITKIRKYLKADERIKILNVHGVGFRMTLEE